jgi:hypothetical protein
MDLIKHPEFGEIRTEVKKQEPWFVAQDVCDALGIQWKGSDSLVPLDNDEKGVAKIYTPGRRLHADMKMKVETPYEYVSFKNKLGVQGAFLFDGRNAHEKSLKLISEKAFRQRIQRGNIVRLRWGQRGEPLLVEYGTLPEQWKNLLVQAFGEAPKRVLLSRSLITV